MITVKVTNGVVGWVNAKEAALACFQRRITALQGLGKLWQPNCPLRDAAPVVKWIKEEIDRLIEQFGEPASMIAAVRNSVF